MKPSELNPDFVKFQNDTKKKKLTTKHRIQKLTYDIKYYKDQIVWYRKHLAESVQILDEKQKEFDTLNKHS